jgi:hypothetical protein
MQATFAGANIKGTPKMSAAAVQHDLQVLMHRCDVFGVQEFRWPWYWHAARQLLFSKWRAHPGFKTGVRHPIRSAQAVFWKRELFKFIRSYTIPAFDLKEDTSGIMDDRWMRAVLLEGRDDGFRAWFFTTHFVVGGDKGTSGPHRQRLMRQNLAQLDKALTYMEKTGYPIMGEFDANIHRGTWAYGALTAILKAHDATLHGARGIEYAFSMNGKHGAFHNVRASIVSTAELRTDHEIRVLKWEGVKR